MGSNFAAQPGFMSGVTAAQTAASGLITSAFATISPAQMASFATAMGPLAVPNMIPAFFEAVSNNATGGVMTAATHGMLGAGTQASQAAYTNVDQSFDPVANTGANNFPAGVPQPADGAAPGDGAPLDV